MNIIIIIVIILIFAIITHSLENHILFQDETDYVVFDDWDAIQIIEDTEYVFGIKISDEEAESTSNFGDLYNLVISKITNRTPNDQELIWWNLETIVKNYDANFREEPLREETKFIIS